MSLLHGLGKSPALHPQPYTFLPSAIDPNFVNCRKLCPEWLYLFVFAIARQGRHGVCCYTKYFMLFSNFNQLDIAKDSGLFKVTWTGTEGNSNTVVRRCAL